MYGVSFGSLATLSCMNLLLKGKIQGQGVTNFQANVASSCWVRNMLLLSTKGLNIEKGWWTFIYDTTSGPNHIVITIIAYKSILHCPTKIDRLSHPSMTFSDLQPVWCELVVVVMWLLQLIISTFQLFHFISQVPVTSFYIIVLLDDLTVTNMIDYYARILFIIPLSSGSLYFHRV